jgi:hypothetical protein
MPGGVRAGVPLGGGGGGGLDAADTVTVAELDADIPPAPVHVIV